MRRQSREKRVANSARWLDENFPGWVDRIDIATLELTDSQQCICGQVFARTPGGKKRQVSGYSFAMSHLFAQANGWITELVPQSTSRDAWTRHRRAAQVSDALGFSGDDIDALEREWKKLLRKRQLVDA